MDDSFKALLDWAYGRLSVPLARSVTGCVLTLSCGGILILTFEGYGWRYVFLSAWFLGSATMAVLVCLFVAWNSRRILNSASKFFAVPILVALGVVTSVMTWRSAQFVYNDMGVFEQRTWHQNAGGQPSPRWTWLLRASSDTPLKFDVRVDSICDHVDIIAFYPVPHGSVSPVLAEVGYQLPRSRMWEIDQFRRPTAVEFILELNDNHADANRCVVHELRM